LASAFCDLAGFGAFRTLADEAVKRKVAYFGKVLFKGPDRVARQIETEPSALLDWTRFLEKVAFVEKKSPDMSRIATLLEDCAHANAWANRGPLYERLRAEYSTFLRIKDGTAIVPCANGGIALEAMARLHEAEAGRKLRWTGSAFSFKNLARGYFADMQLLDCDRLGLLDIDALRALDPTTFDGVVLVNPFGLFDDFSAYIDFTKANGKALLIDNAAGLGSTLPDWPWQSFSLHHTKPFGAGEGGLALVPCDAADSLYDLLNYGATPTPANLWLNNGKISDISCAFLIDRLERVDDWLPRYLEQAERVCRAAEAAGLTPLSSRYTEAPATSWAFSANTSVSLEIVVSSERLALGKYYQPLLALPGAQALYDGLVNIPTHPDVAELNDYELASVFEMILQVEPPPKG